MASTPPTPTNSTPEVSATDLAKARECFAKAQELAKGNSYDYAIEWYLNGLEYWPDAVEEGHKPCRASALFRGKGKVSFTDRFSQGGKDAKKAMLNAERLLAKDPQNLGYMEVLFKSAEKGGYIATAMWIGEIYADAAVREAKPNPARFQLLCDVYDKIAERTKESDAATCITALERALDALTKLRNLKPTDAVIANEHRNMAGKLTIARGKYREAESFRDSVYESDEQKEIYDKERLIQADERVEELIVSARAKYEANPKDQRIIYEYVDLLCRREQEPDEKKAISVLVQAHKDLNDYRFKSRACDIRMKQNRRKLRALEKHGETDRAKQQAKDNLQFELSVYKDRIKNYPTDMRLRYEYGRRLFEAGQYDEAIPMLQEGRSDRKVRFHCSLFIGRCFFEKSYFAQAADTLREAIAAYEIPDDELGKELHYWLGRSCEGDKRTEDALKIYGQLIQWDYNYRKGEVRERIDGLRASQG